MAGLPVTRQTCPFYVGYARGAPFIRAAIHKADRGMVFDNSSLNKPPSYCLTFANGRLVFAVSRLPDWIRSVYETDLEI